MLMKTACTSLYAFNIQQPSIALRWTRARPDYSRPSPGLGWMSHLERIDGKRLTGTGSCWMLKTACTSLYAFNIQQTTLH